MYADASGHNESPSPRQVSQPIRGVLRSEELDRIIAIRNLRKEKRDTFYAVWSKLGGEKATPLIAHSSDERWAAMHRVARVASRR